MRHVIASVLLLGVLSCAHTPALPTPDESAERYVKLALALGEHDSDWVDAYYGPPQWRDEVRAEKKSVAQIHDDAVALRAAVEATPVPADRLLKLRRNYLLEQLEALVAKAEMIEGKKFSFEEEARRLYGVTPERHDDAFFEETLAKLGSELPGKGLLGDRLEAYRSRFVVPPDRVDAVMQAALQECRARTLAHIELPPGETFDLEYVKDKPWGGYNWYKGNFHSLIQVNTDLPFRIDRALGLACHEGYPGHHAYNSLLERNLVRDRGWVEYTIYPLNSPQSLIAEGSANYGVDFAFPGNEKAKFHHDVLFPLAGFDPAEAERYDRVDSLTNDLGYVTNEAARRWISGELTRDQVKAFLMKYALATEPRAEQETKFIERYRSYVINYNVGEALVKSWIEKAPTQQERWARFRELISSPMLPSDIAQ